MGLNLISTAGEPTKPQGATRAFGLGHPDSPETLRSVGQPDLIGGSTGAVSYVLVGTAAGQGRGFNSACHGAGRRTSRRQALKHWRDRSVVDQLAERDILIRRRASCRIAEEAPGVYKDVAAVVDASEKAGLARNVTRLAPEICLKG